MLPGRTTGLPALILDQTSSPVCALDPRVRSTGITCLMINLQVCSFSQNCSDRQLRRLICLASDAFFSPVMHWRTGLCPRNLVYAECHFFDRTGSRTLKGFTSSLSARPRTGALVELYAAPSSVAALTIPLCGTFAKVLQYDLQRVTSLVYGFAQLTISLF